MKFLLCVFFASVASVASLRATPRFSLLQTAAGVAMMGMDAGAKATIEVGGVTVEAGGMTKLGKEDIMSPKAHGTSPKPVQAELRWSTDRGTADRICSFNRHYAESPGYYETTSFLKEVSRESETVYYDSVTGKPLFVAPRGRSMEAFLNESHAHGWPSFRNEEVVWANMRVLSDGEAVSVDGTHLGHNLPDSKGNRYCINLDSVAGLPSDHQDTKTDTKAEL